MTEFESWLVFIAGLVFFISYNMKLYSLKKVINYLKDNHPDKWQRLGKPSLTLESMWREGWKYYFRRDRLSYSVISRFVNSGEDFNDSKLKELKSNARKFSKICQFLWCVLAVYIIIHFVLKKG